MYRELDDNEILFMVEDNNDYYDILLKKYKPLIINISKKYYYLGKKLGYELEDLIQICNLGLIDALKYYQMNKDNLFYTYIKHCIENKIKTELRSQLTDKRKTINESISFDEILDGLDRPLIDFLEDKSAIDPYLELLEKEMIEKYIMFIQSLPLEVSIIFEMRNEGFSNKEIKKYLEIDDKTITNALKYAKKRLCFN